MRTAALVALLAVSASAATALAGTAAPPARILAVSANPSAAAHDPTGALDLVRRAGARGTFVSVTWRELEPAPGRYDTRPVQGLARLGKRGFGVLLGLQVVNTTTKETPRDLLGTPWDAARMKARFRALVDALRPHLGDHIRYISIGNEVDMFLGRDAAGWAAYGDFYADAVAYLHQVAPSLRVGVTTTWQGAVRKHRRKVAALTRPSDVSMLTYYPISGNFDVAAPAAPRRDFPRMLAISNGRPLVFQEVGYPASRALASSPERQAAFVKHVYSAWKRASGRVPFLNFLGLHDLSQAECDAIARYYGRETSTRLKAYLCSLGLREASGEPKPAWTAFVQGASALKSAPGG